MSLSRETVLQDLSFSFKACWTCSKHIQNSTQLNSFEDPFSNLSQYSYCHQAAILLEYLHFCEILIFRKKLLKRVVEFMWIYCGNCQVENVQ